VSTRTFGHPLACTLHIVLTSATPQVVSQRAMADITGAAVRALAVSTFAKVVRRQQSVGGVSSGAAAEVVTNTTQQVCRQHDADGHTLSSRSLF
jgi:hypothetical protein